jgi:hypothetical protein
MKKLATFGTALLFGGLLCAQSSQSTETTTTTTTTLNGTLMDAGCYTTHTKNTSTSTDQNGTTTTTETHREVTECPVTTTSTSFGLLTPDGRFVRFDDPSNTKVIDMVKHNKDWTTYMEEKKPIKVRVVGTPNGDTVVIRSIQ